MPLPLTPSANLDSFHMTLAKSYPNMRAPSFRPFRTGPTTCDVHYYSSNEGFSPFATVTSGMDVAMRFGEAKGKVDQNEAKEKGNAYFSQFPELSVIKSVKRRA